MMYVTYPDYDTEHEIKSEAGPFEENGVVYVPLAPVCQKLKADFTEDAENNAAYIVKNNIRLDLELDGNAFVKDNRVYAPVNVIEDFFECKANWNNTEKKLVFVTNVNYYRKWNQQENSQYWLELITEDEYPQYLAEEAKSTAESIRDICSSQLTSIAFLTDAHYTPCHNDSLALTRAVNTYKDIASTVKLDGMVLGGDHIYEAAKPQRLAALENYRKHFETINYYPINGNHDNGYIWDSVYIKSEQWANHFDRPEIYNALYDHLPSNGAVFNAKDPMSLYYYIDNTQAKVRYIMLDGHSYVDNDGNNLNPEYDGVGQKQADWLANEALRFDEEGWTALVFIHKMQLPETSPTACIRVQYPIRLILDAYKTGSKLEGIYPEGDAVPSPVLCNYDFSDCIKADIAGVIAGDFHKDYVEYSSQKIPYVYTAAFAAQADDPLRPKRHNGTKSEILFDIITIDRFAKRLFISRVGAGHDRSGIKY